MFTQTDVPRNWSASDGVYVYDEIDYTVSAIKGRIPGAILFIPKNAPGSLSPESFASVEELLPYAGRKYCLKGNSCLKVIAYGPRVKKKTVLNSSIRFDPLENMIDVRNYVLIENNNSARLFTVPSYASLRSFTNLFLLSAPSPEPSTWTMMTVGLGLLGATLRRARRTLGAARVPHPNAPSGSPRRPR